MLECEFQGTTQSRDLDQDSQNQICIAITNLADFVKSSERTGHWLTNATSKLFFGP